MTHDLKILPKFYMAVVERRKTFEVRKDDRFYCKNDLVNLHEYDPNYPGGYTGRVWRGRITYILRDTAYVRKGYVIFSIEEL